MAQKLLCYSHGDMFFKISCAAGQAFQKRKSGVNIVSWMDHKFYPSYKDNWDDELFRSTIVKSAIDNMTIIDIGAGAGIVEQLEFKGLCRKIYGIDPDENLKRNTHLDGAVFASGEKLPFRDNSFDAAISANVWEHVERPNELLGEVRRVLKAGGLYFAKTPNIYHYVTTVSRITPHVFHNYYNKLRGRSETDSFRTVYKMNSKKALRIIAKKQGFEIVQLKTYEGRPEYLRLNPVFYLFGILYERLVNAFGFFEPFRLVHVVILRKQ